MMSDVLRCGGNVEGPDRGLKGGEMYGKDVSSARLSASLPKVGSGLRALYRALARRAGAARMGRILGDEGARGSARDPRDPRARLPVVALRARVHLRPVVRLNAIGAIEALIGWAYVGVLGAFALTHDPMYAVASVPIGLAFVLGTVTIAINDWRRLRRDVKGGA